MRSTHGYVHRRALSLYFFLTCMSFPLLSNAVTDDKPPYETENEFFSEVPNVISATRIRQPLTEAPSSVTVIDRDMIEASGAIEFADVMRLVPGVQVSYPQGNQIAVTYHGFSDAYPRKMQILVDGRSIYLPSLANVDWLFIGVALEDVDRIEVVRGPNSPLYGANSVQGVINIITSQPYQLTGTHVGFTVGDLDTRNGIIRYADNTGQMDYRVTATYEKASGLPGELDSTDDGRDILGLSFRGVLHMGPSDEVDIQMGVDDGRLGAGAELSEDPPAHNKEVSSNHQFINWRHAFENGGDSRLQFYHNAYRSSDNYRDLLSDAFDVTPDTISFLLDGLPDQTAELASHNYKSERYDLEWQYTSPRIGGWRSMLGAGARLNRFKSTVLTNQDQWIDENSGRLFANTEYRPVDSFIAGLGFMAEDSDQFGSYVSPRVSMNYLFTSEHSMRLSYTRAKRNPSLLEDNFKYVLELDDGTEFIEIKRSLEPDAETITSTEIGFIGYWMNRNLFLDIKIFRELTEDVIHSLKDPAIAQPFINIPQTVRVVDNDGTLEVEGVEMQVKYQLGAKDFISLQYANMDATSTLLRLTDSTDLWADVELSVPENTFSALASHSFPGGYEASIAFYSISDMRWLSDGDLIDKYQRWDLRLAKHWKVGKNRLKGEFIVHNIGDDYFTFRDENIFETRFFARFSMDM